VNSWERQGNSSLLVVLAVAQGPGKGEGRTREPLHQTYRRRKVVFQEIFGVGGGVFEKTPGIAQHGRVGQFERGESRTPSQKPPSLWAGF